MDKSERLRVLNALVEHIANGTTAGAGGIMRVPMSDFTCTQEVLGNLHIFDRFDNNIRMVIANQKFNLVRMVMPDPSRWPYRQVTSSVYFLYPNVIMMLDTFGVDFLRIFPLEDSPSKARTVHTWHIKPSIKKYFKDHTMTFEERLQRFREVVENEDYVMAAEVQVNAERGTQSEIVLGRNEVSLQHFHNAYRSGVGRDLLPVEDA